MNDVMETVVEQTNDATDIYTASADAENVSEVTQAAEQTNEAAEVTNGAGEAVEDTASGEDADDGLIFTPVYNGAVTPIKANDTARVTTLLQKGMKFEHMAGDLEKLHQLTAAYGAKTTTELLDRMLEMRENAVKEEYICQYGKEAGEKLFEVERAHQAAKRGTFKDADEAADKASRQAVNERLATELAELQADHPGVASIKDLPQGVVDTALQKGIPLLDAYNRHTLQEQKRTAAAVQKQAHNQKAATGSLADRGGEVSDPITDAMIRGVWGRQ